MSRWTKYLWQALIALGEADGSLDRAVADAETGRTARFEVDLDDDASVRAAFYSIITWEFGGRAFEEQG